MTGTKNDLWAEFDELKRREDQREAELLAKKAEAANRNKEPFDLEKLAKIAEITDQGRVASAPRRIWECAYYVSHPDVKTLEELATHVNKLSLWSGG